VDELLNATAASNLVSASILSALMVALREKGILTQDEVREVYERSLLSIETAQTQSPHSADLFEAARELIEEHLRAERPASGPI
jgi:hypothetical protein